MENLFPKDFLFGVATSAPQVEGAAAVDGRGPSIWDAFAELPGKIYDGSKPDVTCDQYHLYREDANKHRNFDTKITVLILVYLRKNQVFSIFLCEIQSRCGVDPQRSFLFIGGLSPFCGYKSCEKSFTLSHPDRQQHSMYVAE